MDRLDLDILRNMGMIPFAQGRRDPSALRPAAIARDLGLNPDLVRERVRNMEDLGVIMGYQAYPNLQQLGMTQVTYYFELDAKRNAQVAAALEPVEGITCVAAYLGDYVCIDMVYSTKSQLDRRLDMIGRLTNSDKPLRIYQPPEPPMAKPLSLLDWKIIHALRGNALRSLTEVAAELSVSSKTVKRRVERMGAEGSFDVVPTVNPANIPGMTTCEFVVDVDDDDDAPLATLEAELANNLLYWWKPPSRELGAFLIIVFATSARELDELRRAALAVPNVKSVDIRVPTGALFYNSRIDEAIEAHIQTMDRPVSKTSAPVPPMRQL